VVEADTLHEEFPDVPVVPSESLLRELMESRHPELNSEAISAICWYYSYNWKISLKKRSVGWWIEYCRRHCPRRRD